MVASFTGFDFSATSVSPVLMLSSLPKATVSPGFASPRLVGSWPGQGEEAGDALVVGAALDRGAVGEGAGEHAGERQLAAMSGVEGLENVGARRRAVDLKTLDCAADKRDFVPQRLQQPEDAVARFGRAHQHRADQPVAQLLGEIVEHLVARRRHVFQ